MAGIRVDVYYWLWGDTSEGTLSWSIFDSPQKKTIHLVVMIMVHIFSRIIKHI